MAIKRTSTLIVDKKESLPLRVNHSTREWEIFDPASNSYVPTGVKAVPEDDATAIKYYKLNNLLTAPEAPGDSQTSWSDIASLNTAVITNGGWSADPLQVSPTNRFCWTAYYKLENILDIATNTYTLRYTLYQVGLYNNYAVSPIITVDEDGTVTITNPDGTTLTHKLMTSSSYTDLMTMVESLLAQVDSAIYSYSGPGVPTKSHEAAPINTWGIPSGAATATVADIYNVHVGDTWTDTDTFISYRWILKSGLSASDPLSYEWQIISDGALSAALAEIAALGNKTVKIFTTQPTPPYKVGDMWYDTTGTPKVIKTCVVAKDVNGLFSEVDWITPFATKEEVNIIRQDLADAKTNISTALGNISDLSNAFETLETVTLAAMEDSILSESERLAIRAYKNVLDTELELLTSNVSYITSSDYLSPALKQNITDTANILLTPTTGSLDILLATIAAILNPTGDGNDLITTTERNAYNSALATFKTHLINLKSALANALKQIDDTLKTLIDEAIIKATYWSIKSTSPVIYKDASSATASGIHTPITLSGELKEGTSSTLGGFISIQPNGGAETTPAASPVTLNPANTDGKTSYTIRLYDDTVKTTLLDTMTIPVVFKGSTVINVTMSNEADILHANAAGTVSDYSNSGNIVRVFEGIEELTYDGLGTTNGKYNVVATGTNIIAGSKTKVGLTCVFGNVSSMTTDNALISFVVTGKTKSGEAINITKILNFTKSKTGDKGDKGDPGVGIDTVVEWFLVTDQSIGITNAHSGFTTTIPTLTESNKYLWNYEEIKYTDASANYKTPARIIGVYGEKGVGIESVIDYYLASTNAFGITKNTIGWTTTVPVLDAVNKYLWNYEVINFSEGTPKETEPAVIGTYGNTGVGNDGTPGEDALSVTVNIQGHFRNYYVWDANTGGGTWVLLKEIVGGVDVAGTEYVRATATVRKGTKDVTAEAIQEGINFVWWVGTTKVKEAGTALDANILDIGIAYADGTDDQIHLDYDDTNAANWGDGVGAVTPTFNFSIDENGDLIYNVTYA